MEILELIGIAFVVSFIISTYGFLIFVIYRMGRLTEAMDSIRGEMRKVSDSRDFEVLERYD